MVMAVLNTVARALDELPVLVEAMYGEPQRSVLSMIAVLEAIQAGGEEMSERIDTVMAEVDANTVARWKHLLERSLAAATPNAAPAAPSTRRRVAGTVRRGGAAAIDVS